MSEPKKKFYSTKRINKTNANYRIAFGERSNGKTFAGLEEILKAYHETGKQGAYIRRWEDDIRPKRAGTLWNGVIEESKYWKDNFAREWDAIKFRCGAWYLYRKDEDLNEEVWSETPICFAFSLSTMEHDKSTSFPNITVVVFDEFLTRRSYLTDEFVLFMNTLSTIIRHRKDVVVYMFGNTVNKTCPYFTEMGLTNVRTMKQGTIDIYRYGESGLTVAVEYTKGFENSGKNSDVYFAFNNPKLQMITGGAWEMAIYPHLPIKFKPKDILFKYFIIFESEILQCEIIKCSGKELGYKGEITFTYIHRKTTELKDLTHDYVYCPDTSPLPTWHRRITKCTSELDNKIVKYFTTEKVFYQDNEVGEIVRNYLMWCKSNPYV